MRKTITALAAAAVAAGAILGTAAPSNAAATRATVRNSPDSAGYVSVHCQGDPWNVSVIVRPGQWSPCWDTESFFITDHFTARVEQYPFWAHHPTMIVGRPAARWVAFKNFDQDIKLLRW